MGGYPNYLQDNPQEDIGGMDLDFNGGPLNFIIWAQDLKTGISHESWLGGFVHK